MEKRLVKVKMATFDWDQTITVHVEPEHSDKPNNNDEVDAVAVSTYNLMKKQIQGTIKFKSASAARGVSHAANISARERAEDTEFKGIFYADGGRLFCKACKTQNCVCVSLSWISFFNPVCCERVQF
jgi:hypothetical protein